MPTDDIDDGQPSHFEREYPFFLKPTSPPMVSTPREYFWTEQRLERLDQIVNQRFRNRKQLAQKPVFDKPEDRYLLGISYADPLERDVAAALIGANIKFITDHERESPCRLDFFLPEYDLHLEIKGGHSPRIAVQMGRAPNVIAIQGVKSVAFFVQLLGALTVLESDSPC